jgi:hypothetical protein
MRAGEGAWFGETKPSEPPFVRDRRVARRTNLQVWQTIAGSDPLFPIVIYNEWRNSNV